MKSQIGVWRAACTAMFLSAVFAGPALLDAADSSDAAKAKFNAAAELQNDELFDLAVGEYQEFLEKFPDDPLAAKARHYLGICLIQEKKYAAAAKELAEVVAKSPKFELLAETYLNLGSAQYNVAIKAGKPAAFTAPATTYGELIAKFPSSKVIPIALFNQGECLYALGNKAEAVKSYQQLLEKHPQHELRPEAMYAQGVTQLELKQTGTAGGTFETFQKEFPEHPRATSVLMHQGDVLFDQKKYGAAAKKFSEAAAKEGFEQADRATMRQADALTIQKNYGGAADLFASIPAKFKGSSYVTAATLAAGGRYHLAKNHPKAIEWLKKVTGAGAVEAAHWLARSYLAQKKPAEALAAVEKQLPKAGSSRYLVDLLMDQADAIYELPNRRKDAIGLYAVIAEKHSKHEQAPQSLYNAAWAAFNGGQFAAALTYSTGFLEKYKSHELLPDVKSVAADSYLNADKPAEAEKLYNDLLKNNSGHSDSGRWRVLQGWALWQQKKYQDVIAALAPAIEGLPSADAKAEAQFILGSSYFAEKDYTKAKAALGASQAANPKWQQADEVLLLLSRSKRLLDDLAGAEATVRKLLAEHQGSKTLDRAHYHLGEYLYAGKKFKDAAVEYKIVVDGFPSSKLIPTALYWLGWSKLGTEDYVGAAAALSTLIDKHPRDELVPSAQMARAKARRLTGKFAEAIVDLNAYLKTNPPQADKSSALLERGLAEMELKKFDAAAVTFETLLKGDPKNTAAERVKYNLAWSFSEIGRAADAAKVFAQLAAEHPKSEFVAEALYHVGEQQYAQKQYEPATKSYFEAQAKARQRGQNDIAEMASHKLAWSYYKQEHYKKAHGGFDFQVKTFPGGKLVADGNFMAAESLFKQNKFEEALAAYQRVVAKMPAAKDFQILALLHAGQAATQLEEWDEAITFLEDGKEKAKGAAWLPDMLYELGWAKKNKDDNKAALQLFTEVTDMTRREVGARARMMIGEIKFEKKDYAGAVRDFIKVFRGYKGGGKSFDRWKAQSTYEAARCLEELKRPSKAKNYYQEVVDKFPDSQMVSLAKQRLEALK